MSGENNSFNPASIADQLKNLRTGDPEAQVPKEITQAAKSEQAGEVTPQIPNTDGEDPGKVDEGDPKPTESLTPDIPNRDDITIKKKKVNAKEELPEVSETPKTNEDDPEDDDFSGQEPSENFKKLRASQKKYKKRTEELQQEVDALKPLEKYRDIVDLALSPEFHAEYAGKRENLVKQAGESVELYGAESDSIKPVFEQENIQSAKDVLYQNLGEEAADEIYPYVKEFYINKHKEEKELQSKDPKERLAELKTLHEEKLAEAEKNRIASVNLAKQKTTDTLKVILSDDKQASQLWSGVFDKKLTKYIETNLPEKFIDQTEKNYSALYDSLVQKGANLSFEDSRKIAMLTADASMGIMANKVIGILLDTLGAYEQELKLQIGNGNPSIRQSNGVPISQKSDKPLTKEEKALQAVNNVVGRLQGAQN